MKSSLLFIECILSFLLVFSQNSVLVPDYSKSIGIFWKNIDNPIPRGVSDPNIIFTAPSAGYIVGYNCNISLDYWACINDRTVAHKCWHGVSGNFMLPVTKGDVFSINYFYLASEMNNESRVYIQFIPVKAVKESDI